ncbi:hypothetical protein F8388_024516 [Cannabis sativa]|uniref:Cyclic nucleotide-binding domain-containing protein n=1 Tax=Cannabis sativa TaxID=3483 RepID=A0A7J6GB90_CANSA|nr:hypothetical protein F8388_024516 [Cannabis sativa]
MELNNIGFEPIKNIIGRKDDDHYHPWAAFSSKNWSKIFLASCVIGVSIDPLFLYIPIVRDEGKCLDTDNNMKIIALVLRSLTDFAYVLHIIFRLKDALTISKQHGQSIFHGLPWPYLLIDVLAILPIPQVVVLIHFSKITGLEYLDARKFINLILLLQYVPRILRVYLSAKELGSSFDSLARRIFGAFWYFYSIVRETSCWHKACLKLRKDPTKEQECDPGPFVCGEEHPMKNWRKMNEYCPVNPPNATVFDFGIFSQAIESRIVCNATDFPKKFFRSFWWGLKNLSSFGQNLDTSSSVQENIFSIIICILGLLLFLYLIGNLQTYMQLETTKSEKARRKIGSIQPEIESYLSSINEIEPYKKKVIKKYLSQTIRQGKDFDAQHLFSHIQEHADPNVRNTIEEKAELWISKNEISKLDETPKIKKFIELRFEEGQDVDIVNLLYVLPFSLGMLIKKHMCFPILKKVSLLQNMDDYVYETICKYLKPVTYLEKSYIIRKGEPLDMMLLITQGVVWTFGSSTCPIDGLQKGDFFGNELIEWQLNLESSSYKDLPISSVNLKSHTKVEGFALMAIDLKHVLSSCWHKFHKHNSTNSNEDMKSFAAISTQRIFRCYRRNRKAQKNKNEHSISMN